MIRSVTLSGSNHQIQERTSAGKPPALATRYRVFGVGDKIASVIAEEVTIGLSAAL